jgi:hypothetical protein
MHIDPRPAVAALTLAVAWGATSVAAGSQASGAALSDTRYLHITAVAPGHPGRDSSDGRWFVYLVGYIDTGAAARLERMLDKERVRSAVVYFDSPGGHVVEAMALGRLLRERRYATSVGARAAEGALPRPGRCYSACPIAFAGGVLRSVEPGSVLGVHRAENRVPVPDEPGFQYVVSAQVRDYLAEMGVSGELATIMSAVPNDAIRELTTDEAVRFGLVNSGDPRHAN